MTIPASKRKPSQFQLFIDIIDFRSIFTKYISNDFKDEKIQYIHKDNICYQNEQYWILKDERISLLNLVRDLQKHAVKGNSIYPTKEEELYERRKEQTLAICAVEFLIQELQFVCKTFDVNAEKYIKLIPKLESIERKLKAWRKSTKRFEFCLSPNTISSIQSENLGDNL